MKTRVTFRVADDLAEALRELPNQTHFVESVLREALGRSCPVCAGSGRVPGVMLRVSNFKQAALPALEPGVARHLQGVVRLGRKLAATEVELEARDGHELGFSVKREHTVLLSGSVDQRSAHIH